MGVPFAPGTISGDRNEPDRVVLHVPDGSELIIVGPSRYQFVFDPTLRIVDAFGVTVAFEGDDVVAGGYEIDASSQTYGLCGIERVQ